VSYGGGGGPALARPGEVIITPYSYQSLGVALRTMAQTDPAAAAWPAANLVIFVPFWVPEAVTMTKMFYGIGASGTANLDMGIYAEDGTRLVSSGSVAASGSTTTQVIDITDTTLARGRYYMAMEADTVTTFTAFSKAPAVGICQALGLLEQASVAIPLSTNASPATFAKYTRAYIPFVGVQGYRTVGP
jgi:hypothetical protein